MSTEAGPSTQRLSTLVSYATSDLDSDSESPPPSPATTAAPASTGLGTTSATPVNITPAPATSIFSAQPLLAAMAERWQAPTKATTAFGRILRMERVREVDMRVGKVPTFARSANQEAILGQSRGVEKYEGCEKCEEGEGPFTSCVTVAGEFSGSCSNCHYNSMGATCSFRPCKYLSMFARYCIYGG